MLQNAAFTVSELLRENQQGGGNVGGVGKGSHPTHIRVNVYVTVNVIMSAIMHIFRLLRVISSQIGYPDE